MNSLDFHIIIPFPRAINSRGTENNIREVLLPADILFGKKFALPVGGVRPLGIVEAERSEAVLISDTEATEAAHQEKLLRAMSSRREGIEEAAGVLGIYLEEEALVGGLRQAGVVDDEIPGAFLSDMVGDDVGELRGIGIREIDEANTGVLQMRAVA